VRCVAAGGHTEGSMNVLVDTDEGVACICGDVIYDIAHQIVDPHLQVMELDPAVTGNHSGSKRGEKAAIRNALVGSRFVLPAHDRPGVVAHGRIVGRTFDSAPGPVISNEDFPGKLTSDHREAAHA
jgi:glyoxylase-like metal-dependent hydrolase (beta-lactamase superfamily II)